MEHKTKLSKSIKLDVINKNEKDTKRGPGRPRKEPIKEPKKKMGIQTTPMYNKENIVELIYCSPLIIKKIFSFFMGHSETIQCKFKMDRVDILCKAKRNNKIKISISGKDIHRYYCGMELEYGLSLTYLEPLHRKLKKQFTDLIWFSEEDEKEQKTHIWLKWQYYDDAWNKTGYSLAGTYDKINEKEFDEIDQNKYPISFTLKHKIFKDIVDDASNHGDYIYIRQYGRNKPLCIDYFPEESRFESSNPFNNTNEIKLKSKIGENEIFSVSIHVEDLKSIATTIPSDEIHFMVSKTEDLIMTSYLDGKTVSVKVLTTIVKEK